MSTAAPSQLVRINTAARWLRVPTKWLQAEAAAGRIPCLKAGKVLLCDVAAVEAVLLERARIRRAVEEATADDRVRDWLLRLLQQGEHATSKV
jgi:hypothetical protein